MLSTVKSSVSCRKYRKVPPNIIPVILQIIPEQSILGNYVVARIIGYNFSLGGPLGYSTVTFGKSNIRGQFISKHRRFRTQVNNISTIYLGITRHK